MASPVQVLRVKITRTPINPPELKEMFNLTELPLAPSYVEIEIKGVPVAVVNGLRRVITDEMPGRALQVPLEGFDANATTEVIMLPQFVNGRISCLRLRPQIPAETVSGLRLRLDASNKSASVMSVYAGDLEIVAGSMPEPLFNPTSKLAEIQPGKRLVINGIHISTGYGRDNGIYNVACRAALTHLDLPQHTDAEMRIAPVKGSTDGIVSDWSGYKVSSLVADPRHHLLTACLPATTLNAAEVRAVFADACANIKERLRLISTSVERRSDLGVANHGVQYTVVVLENGLTEGILQIPGETHTIGELLRRTVYDLNQEIAFVSYVIDAHKNQLTFTIRHGSEDVTKILQGAIEYAIETFNVIQKGITRG